MVKHLVLPVLERSEEAALFAVRSRMSLGLLCLKLCLLFPFALRGSSFICFSVLWLHFRSRLGFLRWSCVIGFPLLFFAVGHLAENQLELLPELAFQLAHLLCFVLDVGFLLAWLTAR